MKTVMFVDDEEIIRKGFSTVVQWERHGLNLVCTAENGKDALDYLAKHAVDIIITDIKMPVIDGIELIKICCEKGIRSHFIILTGFDEFEYARSAMQCGVQQYLLKPCDETEIIKACEEAIQELDKSKAKEWEISTLAKGAAQNFMIQYLMLGYCSKKDLQYFSPIINPENKLFHLVLFRCEEKESLLNYAVSNIAEELFGGSCLYHIILPEHIVLFLIASDTDHIHQISKQVIDYMLQYYNVNFTCMDTQETNLNEISSVYWTALENKAYFKTYQDSCVKAIIEVVEEHISNTDLNLKWIAKNKLYMNENYLSKLFIKSTGQKFTHYLTCKRIEYAKALMREDPQIKLVTLCNKLGFENNPAYLSTLFKNQTGKTLTEYKKSILKH